LRNRIAHHEPVFTRNLADDYQRIHDMIAWRSPTAAAWMDGKQTVMTLIAQKP
jgi:ribosomal protein L32E